MGCLAPARFAHTRSWAATRPTRPSIPFIALHPPTHQPCNECRQQQTTPATWMSTAPEPYFFASSVSGISDRTRSGSFFQPYFFANSAGVSVSCSPLSLRTT
jgi:hypothetical protein